MIPRMMQFDYRQAVGKTITGVIVANGRYVSTVFFVFFWGRAPLEVVAPHARGQADRGTAFPPDERGRWDGGWDGAGVPVRERDEGL